MILLSCWVLFAPGVLNDAVRLVSPADDWRTGEGPSWLVVGGGAVGTVTVASLLQMDVSRVYWVEPEFERMGRLGERYASIYANTRNDRVVSAFRALTALDFDASQSRRRATNSSAALLMDEPPLDTAELRLTIDALIDGSAAVRRDQRVLSYRGRVTSLHGSDGQVWKVSVALSDAPSGGAASVRPTSIQLFPHFVIFATGAAPRQPPPALLASLLSHGVQLLPHDDALAPDRLREAMSKSETLRGARFAVVGGSHSGMLAAKNLLDVSDAAAVHVYHPREITLAHEREGWIENDGTGLKGVTRAWAVQQQQAQRQREAGSEAGEAGSEEASSEATDGRLSRVSVHTDAPRLDWTTCNADTLTHDDDAYELSRRIVADGAKWVVWTTGYERRAQPAKESAASAEVPLPSVRWGDQTIDLESAMYSAKTTNAIVDAQRLYGVGIGFPAVHTDPNGREEPRVGYGSEVHELVAAIVSEAMGAYFHG